MLAPEYMNIGLHHYNGGGVFIKNYKQSKLSFPLTIDHRTWHIIINLDRGLEETDNDV
jgi:hypothetical protein